MAAVHEMTFAAFEKALVPTGMTHVANPKVTPRNRLDWLSTRWDSAVTSITFVITWRASPLVAQLPPDGRQFTFDEPELRVDTERLGLESSDQTDLRRVAELRAAAHAWVAAIQAWCRLRAKSGLPPRLSEDVADDYVRLTCDWSAHPWVQARVRIYQAQKAQSARGQAERQETPVEMSTDPRWPSAQVIHARSDPPSPEQAARFAAEQASIAYWIDHFERERTKWSSEFDMIAWDAQSDIEVAQQKIAMLQKLLDAQQTHVEHLEQVVKTNRRRDAEVSGRLDQPGRPKQDEERREIAHTFTTRWVQSVMAALDVKSVARLEEMVSDSSQRNWRRWLNGQAVPTRNSFSALQKAKITRGPNKGQPFLSLATTPAFDELRTLVRLAGTAGRTEEG